MIATHHPITGEPLLYIDTGSMSNRSRLDACTNCALNEASEVNTQWKSDYAEKAKLTHACVNHDCYAVKGYNGVYVIDNEQGRVQIVEWRMEK